MHQRELPPEPGRAFPDHLIDVKKVIAWVREHGHEYGADPGVVFVAGSSAGGHLAALAALTPNDPRFQPGFEHADTSVTAAISLYGYYGASTATPGSPSSPLAYVDRMRRLSSSRTATTTRSSPSGRARFVESLRASRHPVVYAELPGAPAHLRPLPSLRFEASSTGSKPSPRWVRSEARLGR